MKKSEVYSWRLSSQLKSALEEAAWAKRESLAQLLERIAYAWVEEQKGKAEDGEVQRRIREEAMKYVGSIKGSDPERAQHASGKVKAILTEKHAGQRSD